MNRTKSAVPELGLSSRTSSNGRSFCCGARRGRKEDLRSRRCRRPPGPQAHDAAEQAAKVRRHSVPLAVGQRSRHASCRRRCGASVAAVAVVPHDLSIEGQSLSSVPERVRAPARAPFFASGARARSAASTHLESSPSSSCRSRWCKARRKARASRRAAQSSAACSSAALTASGSVADSESLGAALTTLLPSIDPRVPVGSSARLPGAATAAESLDSVPVSAVECSSVRASPGVRLPLLALLSGRVSSCNSLRLRRRPARPGARGNHYPRLAGRRRPDFLGAGASSAAPFGAASTVVTKRSACRLSGWK